MITRTSGVLLTLCLLAAPVVAAQGAPDQAAVTRGKSLWTKRSCSGCHGIGKAMAAPDLAGVTKRRSRAWLVSFLMNTDQMLATDSTAKALLKQSKGIRMPPAKLTEPDVAAVLAFIASEESKLKK